jgi:phenylacetate-CoA ligase
MLDELARFQPAVLEANPAYLARLARFAAACNTRVFQPSIIVLTFELPTAAALRAIRTVFTSPLCSSYGSTEMGYVFMQCEQGRFHQNSAFCRVDFMPFAAAHGGPLLGRMLVTPFNHPWCQYVRFDVGDMLRLNRDGRCACGRDDGIVADSIDGRVKNAIFTDDGRLVSELRVDEALADCPGVFDYQIQQLSSARVTAHIVPADMHAPPHADDVSARLRALLGDAVKVQVDFIEDLPVAPSGKFRRVWSRIPFEVAALHRGDAVRG